MKNNYISKKTYIVSALIVIVIILSSIYAYRWYSIYIEEQTRESYLIKTNTISLEINNLDDIGTIETESPSDYFIYISYKNSKDVLNLEKKLKSVIDDYGLNNTFYYVDITSEKNNKNLTNKINKALNINENYLKNIPAIIYVKNGQITSKNVISSTKNKIITNNDFINLLKNNDFEKISQ